jgi:hypothetical protein
MPETAPKDPLANNGNLSPSAEVISINPMLAAGIGDIAIPDFVHAVQVPQENPADYLARRFPTEYGALQDAKAEAENRSLDEFINTRTNEALRGLEFRETPELQESVHGFYEDHYHLATAIKAVAEGNYGAGIFTKILENPKTKGWERNLGSQLLHEGDTGVQPSANAVIAAYRIAEMAQDLARTESVLTPERAKARQFNLLKQCGVALDDKLFRETSVGITTIGEGEVALAQELAASLQEQSGGRLIVEMYNRNISFPSPEDVEGNIRRAIDTFWSDTRHAGQLEFHASTTIGGVNRLGLMSRNQQVRVKGSMTAQTMLQQGGSGLMHSVVPHFSEFYGGGQYGEGNEGGTVAIPLINIMREAPYARDAQYGLLIPKNDTVMEKVPKPTIKSPVDSVGVGRSDRVGATGPDRVFFASPDERSDRLPDDYTIKIYDKKRRPPVYIVDRNIEDKTGGRELRSLGLGYGAPERIVIEKGQTAEGTIRELQELYIRENAHLGIVVPLRRGVFAQSFENVDVADAEGRAGATIYNRYEWGSEKQPA